VNKLKASACLTIRASTGNQEAGIGSRGLEHSRKHARLELGRARGASAKEAGFLAFVLVLYAEGLAYLLSALCQAA
jgi:hypothetical protein